MGLTAHNLPYPEPTDSVDVVRDIKALALASETIEAGQDPFFREYFSAVGNLNAVTGVDTALVALFLPNGYWNITCQATCDWSVTGTARYWFSVTIPAGTLDTWQLFVPGTSGTVRTTAELSNVVLPNPATQVLVLVHTTGVTGGTANVNAARLFARRIIPVAG